MPTYLTPQQAVAHLGLASVDSLYSMLHRRRKAGRPIRTYRLNGRLRFKPADLEAAMTVEDTRGQRRAS